MKSGKAPGGGVIPELCFQGGESIYQVPEMDERRPTLPAR